MMKEFPRLKQQRKEFRNINRAKPQQCKCNQRGITLRNKLSFFTRFSELGKQEQQVSSSNLPVCINVLWACHSGTFVIGTFLVCCNGSLGHLTSNDPTTNVIHRRMNSTPNSA